MGARSARVTSLVNEAAGASGVDISTLVDEIKYDPAGSYFTVDPVSGQRTLAIGASAFEQTAEGQLIAAAHEIVHAQQWEAAFNAAGGDLGAAYDTFITANPFGSPGYALDEVAAETLARQRISDYVGGISSQQWAASSRYINSWR